MATPIEDYAFIGDCRSGALVGRDGSIDWLCLPRFDSASLFGRLLGDENSGHWRLRPAGAGSCDSREYRSDTFILGSRWLTETGEVEVIDFMPQDTEYPSVIRRVRGIRGSTRMRQEIRIRFGYASALPWVRQVGTTHHPAVLAVAGPDSLIIRGPALVADDHVHVSDFTVAEGESVDIELTWFPSHRQPPRSNNTASALRQSERWWQEWARGCSTGGHYDEAVRRSLLVLRALTDQETGGIVAAATTSLPEEFGGIRNWDYRYVWLRDASLALMVLLSHGYEAEALAWRSWLLRAIAGDPADIQIMYGLEGERRLAEYEIDTLPGYDNAAPVRIGNGAYRQFQLDAYGLVMVALDYGRSTGVPEDEFSWPLQVSILQYLVQNWHRPDRGIWEIRGRSRHFTNSRAMVWAAFDRGIRAAEAHGLRGPIDTWRRIRSRLEQEIEAKGYHAARGHYVQHADTTEVDASLLQLAQVGYVPFDDPRMVGTVAQIEATLMNDGIVQRYRTETGVDGLPGGENAFLACSFWLVEHYARTGRLGDATALMDRLLGYANDVGMLSEQYDVARGRQAGNTPQALSHLALVRAADAIAEVSAPGQ